jgi:hypothetical protein
MPLKLIYKDGKEEVVEGSRDDSQRVVRILDASGAVSRVIPYESVQEIQVMQAPGEAAEGEKLAEDVWVEKPVRQE